LLAQRPLECDREGCAGGQLGENCADARLSVPLEDVLHGMATLQVREVRLLVVSDAPEATLQRLQREEMRVRRASHCRARVRLQLGDVGEALVEPGRTALPRGCTLEERVRVLVEERAPEAERGRVRAGRGKSDLAVVDPGRPGDV